MVALPLARQTVQAITKSSSLSLSHCRGSSRGIAGIASIYRYTGRLAKTLGMVSEVHLSSTAAVMSSPAQMTAVAAKAAKQVASQNSAGQVKAVMSGDVFGGFKIEGISIAGQETSIILPELGVVFDTGRCPQKSCFQPNVLISHAHLDHIGGLPFIIATRGMHGLETAKVYLPKEIAELTEKLLSVYGELGQCEWPANLSPCSPGDECPIKPQVTAIPFHTKHTVLSQGYLLMREKKKLKKKYLGLPGKEIKRLKEEGTEIEERLRTPEVAFTGDTTIDFLDSDQAEQILGAKLLIMELTTLDDLLSPEDTMERGHTHLEHVIANADRFKNQFILFNHVSARYSREEVLEILNRRLPDELKSRCGVLLEGFK